MDYVVAYIKEYASGTKKADAIAMVNALGVDDAE